MEPKTTVHAKNKLVRISARKLRLVADVVRGKEALYSLDILAFQPKKGSQLIAKVVKSAIANAEHNHGMKAKDLFIKEIRIDEGPVMKRIMAGPRGKAKGILKRTASIDVILAEKK